MAEGSMESDKQNLKNNDKELIFSLINRLEASSLTKLKFKNADFELEIEVNVNKEGAQRQCEGKVIAGENKVSRGKDNTDVNADEALGASGNEETGASEGTFVYSPLAGIFYSASKPGAAPYVAEGQQVKKGDVVGLVEAMKMMNEITAPVSGVIRNIKIKNEEFAEFKQELMEIV